jgi:DNA-directed RNA polymerase alpha subunit
MRLPTIKRRAKRTLEETLNLSLAETSLSLRTLNALEGRNICTVRELLRHTPGELLEIDCIGPKALEEIFQTLESLGLRRSSNAHSSWAA